MEYFSLPYSGWHFGGLDKITYWHFRLPDNPGVVIRKYWPKRTFPAGFTPFGVSQWWCLSRACINYIYTFTKQHSEFVNFFEHVFIPDEIFYQTIILNSPFSNKVVNDNLRYIDWSTIPAPKVLGQGDYETLITSAKLFARKFDVTKDSLILDMIDQHHGTF